MPNIAENDIMEVTFRASYQGSVILNVFHFKVTTVLEGTDYELAMNALGTALLNKYWAAAGLWRDIMVSTYRLNYIRLQKIRPSRLWYIDSTVDQAGAVVEDGIPSNLAAVVIVRSENTARGKSGSKHLTGFARSELEPDVWSADIFDALTELGTQFRDDVVTAAPIVTYTPVIYDRLQNTAANIIGMTVVPEVRIMRRRTKGLGI